MQENPFQTWANEHRDKYLDEMLRLEGRGGAAFHSKCAVCSVIDPRHRCVEQGCFGADMYCQTCIVEKHAVLPTHWIEVSLRVYVNGTMLIFMQEWNGVSFVRRSLESLGLVVQLGHPVGDGCSNGLAAHEKFTVIDLTGIHIVKLRFCKCDSRIEHRQQLMRMRWWPATARDPQTCATFGAIRLFVLSNCQGKITAHDFLKSLELLTNNDGLDPPPVSVPS